MRFTLFMANGCAAIVLAMLVTAAAGAQATTAAAAPFGLERGQVPALEIGGHYAYFHANAPPSQCGCFSMEGGGGTIVFNAPRGLSLMADLTGAHTSSVSGSTETLTILNVLAGGRYSYRKRNAITPYAEVLVGRSLEYSNVSQASDKSALAVSGGGGVTRALSRYFGWQIVQADYVYSRLPNAKNDHQNNVRVSTGIFFRIGPK
jgi:outer membrane immunogenic protein